MLQRMLNRLRGVNDDEKGFTLIELLVVILIIGILAAIALPTFLGQQKKAQDSSAKSDARNAVTQIESCVADASDAVAPTCGGATNKGLAALGTDVVVTALTVSGGSAGYVITATSKSTNTYVITKNGTTGQSAYTTSNPDDTRWAENNS